MSAIGSCGKMPSISNFPMFVPSLSCVNDHRFSYKWGEKAFFSRTSVSLKRFHLLRQNVSGPLKSRFTRTCSAKQFSL
jgi:hypothetical protein